MRDLGAKTTIAAPRGRANEGDRDAPRERSRPDGRRAGV